MKHRLFYLIGTLSIMMAISLMTYIGFYLFYPFNVVEFQTIPFKVTKSCIAPGDSQGLILDFEKHIDADPKVKFFLIDGYVKELSSAGVRRPVGNQKFITEKTIPADTFPGEYFIQIDLTYEINFIRDVDYTIPGEQFIVSNDCE